MKRYLGVLTFFFISSQFLTAQIWDDIIHAGCGGSVSIADVAIDEWGNIYTVGNYSDTLDFGDTAYIADSTNPIFITKHDSMGNRIWYKSYLGSEDAHGQNVEVGPDGYIYVIGDPWIGNITIDSMNFSSYFILKMDSGGNVLWGQPFFSSVFQPGLAIDDQGNAYIAYTNYTSHFFGDIYVDNATGVGADLVVGMMDSTGDAQWVFKYETKVVGVTAMGIDVNNQNQVAITGLFQDSLDLISTSLIESGKNTFLVILNASTGVTIAATKTTGTNSANGTAILADDSGNFVVAGIFKDSLYVGSTGLSSVGSPDAFIASYDNNLNVNWVRQISAVGLNSSVMLISDMGTDNLGNYYVCGRISEKTVFETDTINSDGFADLFVAKYDLNGNYYWTEKAGSDYSTDDATGIDVRDNGSIAICGEFGSSEGYFGNDTLPYISSQHIFISSFRDTGNVDTSSVPDTTTYVLYNKLADRITIYPNPASEMIYLRSSVKLNAIYLYDNSSRKVLFEQVRLSTGEYLLDTSDLKPGVYFLRAQHDAGQLTKKVVLIR